MGIRPHKRNTNNEGNVANELATKNDPTRQAVEAALIKGDLSQLSTEQRVVYFHSVCESVGLNPLTKPFDYITLNGKLVLYANRNCAEQLRQIRGVSIRITERQTIEGVYVITAQATDKAGRIDESTGAVNVKGMMGEALANAFMKAETKAKRRATLSICGLGLLDETEVSTIPNAVPVPLHVPHQTTTSPVVQLALPPITQDDVRDAEPEYTSEQEGYLQLSPAEEQNATDRPMVARVVKQMAEMKLQWFSEKVRSRASEVIGREVPPNTPTSDLTDEELLKLFDALEKKPKRKAG